MQKFKMDPVVDEKLEQAKQQAISDLKINPIVLDSLRKGKFSSKQIERKPMMIKRWVENIEKCKGCKGLSHCVQQRQGYIFDLREDGILQEVLCPCKYQKEKDRAEEHINNYVLNDMPPKMYSALLTPDILKNESGEYIETYLKVRESYDKGHSIYLHGILGSGKTFLAACMCNEYAKSGKRVAFVHYPTFCQHLVQMINNNEYVSELNKAKLSKFLVLDDIGAESVTEWNRDSILLPLLEYRYNHDLPTIFTSNLDYKALSDHFSVTRKHNFEEVKADRIVERIQAMSDEIVLEITDRRMIGK